MARPNRSGDRRGSRTRRRGAKTEKKRPEPAPAPAPGGDDDPFDRRPPRVGVVMGSDSDFPVVRLSIDTLEEFDIPYQVRILSAHRTPEQVHQYASTARLEGLKVIIAAAGGAAHLAGIIASLTTLPVIGIPIQTPTLGGADSLYSTVQMPSGVPVATVAIGEAGARNAALLAAEILALSDDDLHDRIRSFRAELRRRVAQKDDDLRDLMTKHPS